MVSHLIIPCLFIISSTLSNAAITTTIYDSKLSWKVVGGSEVPEGAYPYSISLQLRGMHGCGASIIAPEWVVTSASCVDGAPLQYLTIAAGSNKLSKATSYTVKEVIAHEDYDPWTDQNDVAILKVDAISNAGPIIIDIEDIQEEMEVVSTGWGLNGTSGVVPDNLQYVNLKTLTYQGCRLHYPISSSQICTSFGNGSGLCMGDNGGPLIRTVGEELRLVGIFSWGVLPCASWPDVFSKASAYRSWFNDKCNCL